MKVKYKPTGGVMESDNEFVTDQWRKRPDLYDEVHESEAPKSPRRGKQKDEGDQ